MESNWAWPNYHYERYQLSYACAQSPTASVQNFLLRALWSSIRKLAPTKISRYTVPYARVASLAAAPVADDPYLHVCIVLGCVREQKAYGLQWFESIGMANKNTAFAILVGLAKWFEAYWSRFFNDFDGFVVLYIQVVQIPKYPDLALFVLIDKQTDGQNWLLYPCICARGKKHVLDLINVWGLACS
jgi:hypothetical protein